MVEFRPMGDPQYTLIYKEECLHCKCKLLIRSLNTCMLVFQFASCMLRWIFNKDTKYHAIPAGLLAGLAFGFFPDNTVALYVMWKSLQVTDAN